MVLWVQLFVLSAILLACALASAAEDGEVPEDVYIRLPEGTSPDFLHVGEITELNASVNGTFGSDLTNESHYEWNVSSDYVSWMPRQPNVIHVFPEASVKFVVTVTATIRGHSISTSIDLAAEIAVEDVRLTFHPPKELFFHGDEVALSVTFLDWKGTPIRVEMDLVWSVSAGLVTPTHGSQHVTWTIDEVGIQTIRVEYFYGYQHGAASYTVGVQHRLTSITLGDIPAEVEVLSSFNTTIMVLDSSGADVTSIADVLVLHDQVNVSDVSWTWDGDGKMAFNPVIPGPVSFMVVAELNGSVMNVNGTFMVTGSLPEPAQGPLIDHTLFVQLMMIVVITVTSILLFVTFKRSIKRFQNDEPIEMDTNVNGHMMTRDQIKYARYVAWMRAQEEERRSRSGRNYDRIVHIGNSPLDDDDAEDDL
jgi:hypothetical protein